MKQNRRQGIAAAVALLMVLLWLPTAEAAKDQPELRNLAAGTGYTWSEQPEPSYGDAGNKLTDRKYGTTVFTDPAWAGHLRKSTRSVVFDLGEKKSIARISANFLQDSSVGIAFPNTVSMYASNDGIQWGNLAHIPSREVRWADVPASTQDYVWDGSKDGLAKHHPNATMAYAQYVKVTFTTDVFVFVDEIEIWGTDGKMNKAKQVSADRLTFQEPGKATGGMRNLVLLNNGNGPGGSGSWTKDTLMPYISYVNKQGEPQDWLFDGVLFHSVQSPSGKDFTKGTATLSDWIGYLDKMFADQGDLQQLNEAVTEAGTKLGERGHKENVVLMIPNPGDTLTDFGDVDGDGVTENFSSSAIGAEAAYANKQKAATWWIQQIKQRWKEEKYSKLKLNGIYWTGKSISTSDLLEPNLIQATSKQAHKKDLNFYWMPSFQGNRNYDGEALGFDAALLDSGAYNASSVTQRLADASGLAKQYQMGLELAFDEQINTDTDRRERYIDILNGGIDYGYMRNAFKAYDQGKATLLNSAKSSDPMARQNYDLMYQFVTGTYAKPRPCMKSPEGPVAPNAAQYVVKCGTEITIAHKYNDQSDMWIVFDRFGANKLEGLKEWRLAQNSGASVNPDMSRPSTLLQADVSDWIGPYVVRANANGNGNPWDFTGGNHNYDGGSNSSHTGTTESFRVWADGVEVADGSVTASVYTKIEVVNLIQAYNTKVADGSGRPVLRETVTYEISNGHVQVHNEIEALEDITFDTYYGLQSVNGAWNDTVRYFAGEQEVASSPAGMYSDSGTKAVNPNVDSYLLSSGDQGGFKHMLRVRLDRQYGLGALANLADHMPVIFTQEYGKTYFLQIKGTTPGLKQGEKFAWRGSYDFYSKNLSALQ
ncbi:DUF4855 domain-containing protein [Paenibacillus sp. GCM10027629]|uniref:DUF4855 domain-containing protein n=1 Tax=Paenibacillus sp. GCM10027629 TaxID=3273414 RepID=UPI003634AAAB